MAFVNIIIHAVWGTKNREPSLTKELRTKVIDHIRENAKVKQIYIDRINGGADHLHCLMRLNAEMSMSKAMQLIKGESAYWVNKEKIFRSKFEWADEYFAVSVSKSLVDNVRAYIDNQEIHHRKKTFQQEYEEFISSWNF